MKKVLLIPIILALTVSTAGCTTKSEEPPKETTKVEAQDLTDKEPTHNIVPEDEPEEVNASAHVDAMNKTLEEFMPAKQYTKKWLQIADDGETWYAVTDTNTAKEFAKSVSSVDGWVENTGSIETSEFTGLIMTKTGKVLYVASTENAEEGTVAFVFTEQTNSKVDRP